ncbi:chromosome partitioning protein ParB [bacterium (Candidatus Howlettbacteria) CG_4_10_14_0_8_um_filter_40_9]|nr:MAG: chromosome partitioning protein ParB [bacterium (Candidatus Howlettbacteria) CG_4_10_14_0_8_um_filter_40_9]
MSTNQRGLGRGLDSLIPIGKDEPRVADGPTNELKISLIVPNPHQPRCNFDEEMLKELADSIREHGVIQPLIVSKEGKEFILIAGERRLRAAKLAGLESVPVILRSTKEQQKVELALIENLQREDLNVLEEASSYKKLIDDFSLTQEDVSKRVGKSRSAVANALRLLSLPVEVKRGLREGLITEGHARVILSLPTLEQQISFYNQIISGKLNVRQAEAKIKSGISIEKRELSIELRDIQEGLTKTLGSKVTIQKKGNGGKIIIEYYSDEELEEIVKKISN